MTLPNFLVIGAQRSGTSLLHQILKNHPEIFVPQRRKEVHYFDRYFTRETEWYESYFPASAAASRYRAVGEVTPDYLGAPDVPARICDMLPEARLVAILRHPVDRAYSWYNFSRRNFNESRDFESFLRADQTVLLYGLYHQHLERYLTYFSRESLLILIYEELITNPGEALSELADFLGLTRAWPSPSTLVAKKVNTSELPRLPLCYSVIRRAAAILTRHDVNWPVRIARRVGVRKWLGGGTLPPPMSPETRAWLESFFEEDIRKLAALLQRDLGIWKAR